jgi:hypothetical protein
LGINFDDGLGYDTLILASQKHSQNFDMIADDAIKIDRQIIADSVFLSIFKQNLDRSSISQPQST